MRLLAVLLCVAACRPPPCYPEGNLSNFTSYPEPGTTAPADQTFAEQVAACLVPLNDTWLSDAEAREAECLGPRRIEVRECLRVAEVPDWHLTCDGSEQVFNCSVGPQRCLEKGQVPTPECPCSCRAQIQYNTVVWTTPNRKLLAAYLVTLFTGCLSPWTPTLAPCSNLKP